MKKNATVDAVIERCGRIGPTGFEFLVLGNEQARVDGFPPFNIPRVDALVERDEALEVRSSLRGRFYPTGHQNRRSAGRVRTENEGNQCAFEIRAGALLKFLFFDADDLGKILRSPKDNAEYGIAKCVEQ
jgi:hypothetical protein